MAELGFWETLIIVISPVIIGAISTRFLSRSWQVYQHKIKLKQELIDLYNESTVSLRSSQVSLVADIAKTFAKDFSTSDSDRTGVYSTPLFFPIILKKNLRKFFYPNTLNYHN